MAAPPLGGYRLRRRVTVTATPATLHLRGTMLRRLPAALAIAFALVGSTLAAGVGPAAAATASHSPRPS